MKTTATPVRSQLHNAGANAPMAPVSAVARFVAGDIHGKEAAHTYRMDVIAASIREALKGNSRALIEAAGIATGRNEKARAYAAGFAAIGLPHDVPARVQYSGKLDAPENEEARRIIAERSRMYEFDFESAFLTMIEQVAEEKKAKREAKKAEAAPAADEAATDEAAPATVAEVIVPVADVADVVGAAVRALESGLASATEADMLRAALAQYDAARATLVALEKAQTEAIAA